MKADKAYEIKSLVSLLRIVAYTVTYHNIYLYSEVQTAEFASHRKKFFIIIHQVQMVRQAMLTRFRCS